MRHYRIPVVLIGLGILFIALVWRVNNKFIALPLFLLGALGIVFGLSILSFFFRARLIQKYHDYDGPIEFRNFFDRIAHYGGFTLGVSGGITLSIAGSLFENTIRGNYFFGECAGAGLFLATVFYYYIKLFFPGFFVYNEKRQTSIFMYCIGIVSFTCIGIAWYNKTSVANHEYKIVWVERKGGNAKYGNSYLFIQHDGRKERFVAKRLEYEELAEKDSVLMEYGTGALGFGYVFRFSRLQR